MEMTTDRAGTKSSGISVCQKCGAQIHAVRSKYCPACLLEAGLTMLQRDESPSEEEPILAEFGDYALLEEIGRGGQGVVYRARQKSLNRLVALKIIGLGHRASETHLKRFRREAEAAARLEHPRIIPIYEIGERDGACYFSMKLEQGGQLDRIVRQQPVALRHAAEIIASLARTVHYAHERGILHRDIKPGNILLDAQGEPHLADFGLVRLVESDSTVTRTQEVLGTPSYIAPEQAAGQNEQVTSATDVYGLGAVFYQLLTSHPPFAGGTTYETIRLVIDTEPRNPRLWNPKIDRDLTTICLKCLEKDPSRRFKSTLELAEDLERWLKHEPIHARRTGPITRSIKWVRRNTTTAALLATLAGLATTLAMLFLNREPPRPPTGIAVLPFANLDGSKSDDVLVDGLQDDILTRLATVASLKVISRTSVMQYRNARNMRQIRDNLHVSHALEGSVRRDGDKIHLNAQLIDTQTDEHIWAEQYDRNVNDVFAVQDEIAQKVASQLQAKLSAKEEALLAERPTTDPVAYAFYEQATNPEYDKLNGDARIQLLQEAIQRDPNFLLAYCQLAKIYTDRYGGENMFSDDKRLRNAQLARETIEAALRLRPDRGESHLAKAFYDFIAFQFAEARNELDLARKLLPNDSEATFLDARLTRHEKRWDEALVIARRAVELDPNNDYFVQWTADAYLGLRRYRECEQFVQDAITRNPAKSKVFSAMIAATRLAAGDLEGARQLSTRCTKEMEDGIRFYVAFYRRDYSSALAMISARPCDVADIGVGSFDPLPVAQALTYRAQGENEKAETILRSLRLDLDQHSINAPHNEWYYAYTADLDALLGLKEQAIAEGRKAVAMHSIASDPINGPSMIGFLIKAYAATNERELAIDQLEKLVAIPSWVSYGDLRYNPRWDALRGDPRFDAIVVSLAPKAVAAAR